VQNLGQKSSLGNVSTRQLVLGGEMVFSKKSNFFKIIFFKKLSRKCFGMFLGAFKTILRKNYFSKTLDFSENTVPPGQIAEWKRYRLPKANTTFLKKKNYQKSFEM